jgi:hypothetical protein
VLHLFITDGVVQQVHSFIRQLYLDGLVEDLLEASYVELIIFEMVAFIALLVVHKL